MRKEFYISCLAAALAVITPGFVFLTTGCKKTNQPLGYDAPNGLDVPSPTPLPLSGAIVVNVSDTNSVVTNLTVQAIEPGAAVTLTSTTNGEGQVAFSPNPLPAGVWTIQIPQQTNTVSNYDLSQQFVTIGPDFTHAILNFTPGSFSGEISAVAGTSYPSTLQNSLVFDVSVSQTGFLNVPVTYAFVGLPFSVNPAPTTLDMFNPQQSVTVQVPSCSVSEPAFHASFNRIVGSISGFSSNPVTITRGYPITILAVTHSEQPSCQSPSIGYSINDIWTLKTTTLCSSIPFNVHIVFTSTNDSSSSTPNSENFDLYPNTPYTFNWKPTQTSPVKYAVTITNSDNSSDVYSSSFIFDPHFGYGGSCGCGAGGYTGCQALTTITDFTNLVVNP